MKSKYSQLKEMLSANSNVTGLRKNSNAYNALERILHNGESNTAHTTGHGRYTTLYVYTCEVKEYLDKFNIAYEVGNDAPRGGKHGEFIKVTDRAFLKVMKAERWAEMEENAKPVCVARIFENIDGWREVYKKEKSVLKGAEKRFAILYCAANINRYEDIASIEFVMNRTNEQIEKYLTKHNKL